MSDKSGQATALTAFNRLESGREDVERYLRDLPRGSESPLARLPHVHFARWVVIDRLPADPPEPDVLDQPYLLFTACVDGDTRAFARELGERLRPELDSIWGRCAGYPGAGDAAAFADWLLDHHVPTSFFVAAYGKSTVQDVRNSLAAREQVLGFALRAQSMDPARRLDAFKAAFPA
jgi:hypothetical protein